MKEQNKIPEKELSKMEIANLSDAEFKILIIRMLRELLGYGKKVKEEMKVTLSQINNNSQKNKREGKVAGIQTNHLKNREEINFQAAQKEEKNSKKLEKKNRWRNL